jgi:hypothetical protein
VFVAPDGELTDGISMGLGDSTFEGESNDNGGFTSHLQVLTCGMDCSSINVSIEDGGMSSGSGMWCNNDPNTNPIYFCVGSPEPVPEPATLVLVAVPMLLCVWYARRLGPRSRLAPL